MTSSITLYTKDYCPFCRQAKTLLTSKGVIFRDIDISDNEGLTRDMINRSNRQTVPQIFIGDLHIGGATDLFALEDAGLLDSLLERTLLRVSA